jgi:Aspartyl protease
MPNQHLLPLLIVSALSSVVSARTSDTVIPSSSTVVDLPMRFRGPEPAVEVMVNRQGPFLFAIDTGATDDARIDSSMLTRLGLRVSGSDRVGDGSGGTGLKVGTVRLDSIAIGALEFRRVKASIRDFNTVGLPHIDGLLTFDLFRDLLLTLDYPATRVRLEYGELPKVDDARILRLKRVHGHPAVDISIGSERVTAEIDSGNVVDGFLFPEALVMKLPLATRPVDAGKARTVTHEFDVKTVRLQAAIRLGEFEFVQPQITFPTPFPFANIGSRILDQFAVTFDQKRDRIRFVRHNVDERN